ncbi:hypothetical protein BYT27DRAFT_7260203 [Phlegmacium glaucopus]|nr:hypothetical protein BYT27DRAFT_7260203 [Phlegmacium glaucopus]
MSNYSLFTTSSHMVVQGDCYIVDYSRNTTNTNSHNTIETVSDRSQPPSSLESTSLSVPCTPSEDGPSSSTIPQQRCPTSQTEPSGAPAARRTSTSSSNNVEHLYPPTPRSTRPLAFQRAPYPYLNIPSEVDIPEPLGTGTTPAAENLCQYVFIKIKAWFDRLLSYIFTKPL